MPGYSGTPLPKKLGIKEAFRVTLVGLPADVEAELRERWPGARLSKMRRSISP